MWLYMIPAEPSFLGTTELNNMWQYTVPAEPSVLGTTECVDPGQNTYHINEAIIVSFQQETEFNIFNSPATYNTLFLRLPNSLQTDLYQRKIYILYSQTRLH